MYLLFTEIGHLTLALFAGGAIWKKYKSGIGAWCAIFMGFFIDLDHLMDYLYYVFTVKKSFSINLMEFFSCDFVNATQKVFIFLHSIELMLLLTLFGRLSKKYKPIFFGLALGMFVHILWDYITNTPDPFAYSLIYRISQGFSLAAFSGIR